VVTDENESSKKAAVIAQEAGKILLVQNFQAFSDYPGIPRACFHYIASPFA
jgi:hypothetical protein